MNRTDILAVTAVLALVIVGVWVGERYRTEAATELRYLTEAESNELNGIDPNLPSDSVDEDAFEKLATASCKCTRSGDGSDEAREECWREYEAAKANLETYGMATACAPISTEIECVATDAGEKCWVISLGYDEVCTGDDARAVESAWSSAYSKAEQRGDESPDAAANDAVDRVLARLRRGESVAAAPGSGGCAG